MRTEFWISLDEAAPAFGYTNVNAALNAIYAERFPVPTYKVGRRVVIDLTVYRDYFERQRELASARINQRLGGALKG